MSMINSSLTHASKHAAEAGILPSVWKLLFLRLRITYNGFLHAKLGKKIRIIFVWLLLLGFAYFILATSRWLLGLMRSPEFVRYAGVDLRGILASIPALTLTALFVGTLLTSFGVLLQALYLSGDMDFLLATPVPIRAVFTAKLLQAVLPNFALFSLFGIPMLFGLGIYNGYYASYYPLVILLMIFLALAASGLSSLLVMLVVRVLPPWFHRRDAGIPLFANRQSGQLVWQGYQFFRDPHRRSLNTFQHALAAVELGRTGVGGVGRRSLAIGLSARGSYPRYFQHCVLVCPRHGRTPVLLWLGRDAGCRPQKEYAVI